MNRQQFWDWMTELFESVEENCSTDFDSMDLESFLWHLRYNADAFDSFTEKVVIADQPRPPNPSPEKGATDV